MKEKTFEELIEELHNKAGRNFSMKEETAELMQQVREATIAECNLIAAKYYFQDSGNILIEISNLPPDRIKIEP